MRQPFFLLLPVVSKLVELCLNVDRDTEHGACVDYALRHVEEHVLGHVARTEERDERKPGTRDKHEQGGGVLYQIFFAHNMSD